jgi:hypothetical protein
VVSIFQPTTRQHFQPDQLVSNASGVVVLLTT